MLTASKLQPADVSRQVAELFTSPAHTPTDGSGRVDLELEWIPRGLIATRRERWDWRVFLKRLANDPSLFDEAKVAFEPGGQLEISPLPVPGVTRALDAVAAYETRLRRCLQPAGIELFSSGMSRGAR
jgi:gamma-glutamylcysteine synthetase